MKKLIIGLTGLLLITNTSIYAYYDQKLEQQENKVIYLQDDIRTKSIEIANLEDTIQENENQIGKQQSLIEAQKRQINDKNHHIDAKNGVIEVKQQKINQLQKQLDRKEKEEKEVSQKSEVKTNKVTHTDNKKSQQTKDHTKQSQVVKEVSGKNITVSATAYTASCKGCSGITARGTNVKGSIYHSSGYRIIATDPSVIPLGSKVSINGTTYIADDTGGAIKGNKIDILVGSHNEAINFGRQQLKATIIN